MSRRGGSRGGGAFAGKQRVLGPSISRDEVVEGGFDPLLFGKLWRLLRPERGLFFLALLLFLPLTAATLAQPRLFGMAVDEALTVGNAEALLLVVGLFGLTLVVQQASQFAQLMIMQTMGQRAIRRLRRRLFRHLQFQDAAFYDRSPVGRLLTRVTNDMEAIAELFSSGAVTIVGDLMTLTGIVVMLFVWNAELATTAMVSIPLVLVVTGVIRQPARRAFRLIRAQSAHLNTHLTEYLGGMAVIQAAVREPTVRTTFGHLSDDFRRSNNSANLYDASLYALVEAISTVVAALVIFYGAFGFTADVLTLGVVVGFVEYLNRFFVPLRDLSSKYTLVQSALTAAERAFGLLEVRPAVVDAAISTEVEPLRQQIAFEEVSFAYKPGVPVLRKVSFELKRGERVALVGHTGGGKTTVGRLLVRHYDVDEGRILFDGQDLRALQTAALRARFALVLQDVFLFRGTLRDNLVLGGRKVDDAALMAAVEAAGVQDLIARHGGLDGEVGERGLNLSLGERQIIALLRTLVTEPDVLILDEATASVDSTTEHYLQRAIDAAFADRTALVIAHRLSTIRACDRIMVLHHGRLVEQGSHDELMAEGRVYPKLYLLQYQGS